MLRAMKPRIVSLLVPCALAWLALSCVPARASAEVSVGQHLGYNFDWDEPVIGGAFDGGILHE